MKDGELRGELVPIEDLGVNLWARVAELSHHVELANHFIAELRNRYCNLKSCRERLSPRPMSNPIPENLHAEHSRPILEATLLDQSLRINIMLNNLGDLHEFLRDYLINKPLDTRLASATLKLPLISSTLATHRRLDFERYTPEAAPNTHPNNISRELTSARGVLEHEQLVYNPLANRLFRVYLDPQCFSNHILFERDMLMDQFLRGTLDMAFLCSAMALAAQHAKTFHGDDYSRADLSSLEKTCANVAMGQVRDRLDDPSEMTVLAAYNLTLYLDAYSAREAYSYLNLAITLAQPPSLNWESAKESSPACRERRRRLWWLLYILELSFVLYRGKPASALILRDLDECKPSPLSHEGQEVRDTLLYVTRMAEWYTALVKLPGIDFAGSDEEVLDAMASITTTVGSLLSRAEASLETRSSLDCFFEMMYWGAWAKTWFELLEPRCSKPSSERLDTPIMRTLRAVALDESAKAAGKITLRLCDMVKHDLGCNPLAMGASMLACRIHFYSAHHHPNPAIRRSSFHHLVDAYRAMRSRNLSRRFAHREHTRSLQTLLSSSFQGIA
ncbi:uncharacterized protein VTP21DRAFT_6866 [Calcarisporiella thermophila]|uniref:uncharacterized protein n=1 Tax=Calcarisporiella thermophila TaxID=911321 RepID=UPI0037437549